MSSPAASDILGRAMGEQARAQRPSVATPRAGVLPSIAGDTAIGSSSTRGTARDPSMVQLSADYFGKWEAAARVTSNDLFSRGASTIPESYTRAWGCEMAGEDANSARACVKGPVNSVVLSVAFGVGVMDQSGVFCGVRDDLEAHRISANCFMEDLQAAVKAVITRHNNVMREVADDRGISAYKSLCSSGQYIDLPNAKTWQRNIAALDLATTGGIPIDEARAHKATHRCSVKLHMTHSAQCPANSYATSPIQEEVSADNYSSAASTSSSRRRRSSGGRAGKDKGSSSGAN